MITFRYILSNIILCVFLNAIVPELTIAKTGYLAQLKSRFDYEVKEFCKCIKRDPTCDQERKRIYGAIVIATGITIAVLLRQGVISGFFITKTERERLHAEVKRLEAEYNRKFTQWKQVEKNSVYQAHLSCYVWYAMYDAKDLFENAQKQKNPREKLRFINEALKKYEEEMEPFKAYTDENFGEAVKADEERMKRKEEQP